MILSYITTLNLVRLGIKHKVKFIKIPKNKKSTKILFILLKFNIIYGWSMSKFKNHINYLVYCNPSIKNIYTFIKVCRKLPIKYKKLKVLFKKYSTSSIFLSTPKGILSIKDAYEKKTGGFLFFRII